jgi:pSer/pThr/pTyr-binding forkhead associated (FHA) protein
VRIGRAEEANLVLRDTLVSRRHARLVLAGGVARLEDCGSRTAPSSTAMRLQEPRVLAPGDCVALCSVSRVFHRPARARGARAAAGAGGAARPHRRGGWSAGGAA